MSAHLHARRTAHTDRLSRLLRGFDHEAGKDRNHYARLPVELHVVEGELDEVLTE